jgi:hypothetical protein
MGHLDMGGGLETALGSFTFLRLLTASSRPTPSMSSRERTSLTLLAFTQQEYFTGYADDMLSVLDSLAIGSSSRRNPDRSPVCLSTLRPCQLIFRSGEASLNVGGEPLELSFTPGALDNQLVTIEREARIIQRYVNTPYLALAWSRYYRIIYRQGYQELSGSGSGLAAGGAARSHSPGRPAPNNFDLAAVL